ncbi:MAG: carbamoyltransferase C-terminal domain-containing protein [Candidatus Omnitrophota bacterium]
MIILGIYDDHNASCCLYRDSRIVYAAQEERFTREKNQSGFPKRAIEHCLQSMDIKVRDLDYVVFSTVNHDPFWINSFTHRFTVNDYIEEQYKYWRPVLYGGRKSNFFAKRIEKNLTDKILKRYSKKHYKIANARDSSRGNRNVVPFYQSLRKEQFCTHFGYHANILFCDHHMAHAAYAYWAAPARIRNRGSKNLILTLDAFGDGRNCMIGEIGTGNDIKCLRHYSSLNIARFYKYCTLLLGMKPLEHEYKVMGLAPYCKNDKAKEEVFKVYKEALWIDRNLKLRSNSRPRDCYFHFRDILERYRFDEVAAGIQLYFESFVTTMVKRILRKYGRDSLFYGGGAAMNVKTNMEIGRTEEVKNFYVSPSPGDESTSIGACLHTASRYDGRFDRKKDIFPTIYLGYEITERECQDAISRHFRDPRRYTVYPKVSAKRIASFLKKDMVIARATYGMEFGSRALGNRSILANPACFNNVKKINDKIKFRDFWMPFAPVILKGYEGRYIEKSNKIIPSPYMTVAFPTSALGMRALQAAKHPYDNTVRPQILSRRENPLYYDLIFEFGKITGVYALVNTSFNLHGYPIVRTAEDATGVFLKTDLDGLILNDNLIVKNGNTGKEAYGGRKKV